MKHIQKPLTNLVTLHNGKIGCSILTRKPVEINLFQELKYVPQRLSTDVVEIPQQISTQVSQETLQNLVNKNLTLQEISANLNVPISTIRHYLRKYNISRFSEEITALKKYFSTKDPKEKAKAYDVIDKHLQKMAEKEAEIRKEPFEDCLQDIRLRFIELANKKKGTPEISVFNIFKKIENSAPEAEAKIEKVKLKTITNKIGISDYATNTFEDANLANYLLDNSNLSAKTRAILILKMKKDISNKELAKASNTGIERIRQMIRIAISQIKKQHFTETGEFIEPINPLKLKT